MIVNHESVVTGAQPAAIMAAAARPTATHVFSKGDRPQDIRPPGTAHNRGRAPVDHGAVDPAAPS
ncbi:MAG: hypothetical protein R2867_32755 [Caldilineaceae bacterium]